MTTQKKFKAIQIWLLTGIFMVFIQVLIGGITRLTDSGLSITEWKVVEGTLPPLNQTQWNSTFENYKVHAKKQYESLHPNMNLQAFKHIFFWEYFHRLWARLMSLVFIVGFVYFLASRKLNKKIFTQLMIVISLASLEGLFGWIMVSSGLNEDNRTWVSAYKLIIHLLIATLLFAYLCWTYFSYSSNAHKNNLTNKPIYFAWSILPIILFQILLGGLMAGMHAGVVLPNFPLWLHLDKVSYALHQPFAWTAENLVNYEPSVYIKMLVQLWHRSFAFVLSIQIIVLSFLLFKEQISLKIRQAVFILLSALTAQYLLGILTVIGCTTKAPVALGVIHQGMALLLLASLVYVLFLLHTGKKTT